jgi:hypothetical protein
MHIRRTWLIERNATEDTAAAIDAALFQGAIVSLLSKTSSLFARK